MLISIKVKKQLWNQTYELLNHIQSKYPRLWQAFTQENITSWIMAILNIIDRNWDEKLQQDN